MAGNPYYSRKATREAANKATVDRIYRDIDNRRWARELREQLFGPFKEAGTLPAVSKPSRASWRSPTEEEARRELHKPRRMQPGDYDPSKTINVPRPKTDTSYRRAAGFAPKAAKFARAASRFMGPWGRLWDLYDFASWAADQMMPRKVAPYPNPGNGWRMNLYCSEDNINHSRPFRFGLCIGGQAGMGTSIAIVPPSPTDKQWSLWNAYWTPALRGRTRISFERSSTDRNFEPTMLTTKYAPDWMPNPNIERHAPPQGQFADKLADQHERAREALNQPFVAPDLSDKPVQKVIEMASGAPAPPSARPPYAPREPPDPGTRERKYIPRGAIAVWRAVDWISEKAETVDAFYDALPKHVKERWQCKPRGFVDTFGQYGLDGADCKARALWHNWHHVDFEQAIRNVVKNEVADKIIGRYQRELPKNTGQALEDGEKLVAKAIDKILDGIL